MGGRDCEPVFPAFFRARFAAAEAQSEKFQKKPQAEKSERRAGVCDQRCVGGHCAGHCISAARGRAAARDGAARCAARHHRQRRGHAEAASRLGRHVRHARAHANSGVNAGRELTALLAEHLGVGEGNILLANGSDDILNFCFLAFCERGVVFPDISYGF